MFKFKRITCLVISVLLTAAAITPFKAFASSENQIREKIVSVASAEIGYTGTSSYSKYGDWYGYQGGWCTTFVLWCYNEAGNKLGVKLYGNNVTPTGGNCNSMISWYKNKGRYYTRGSYTPKAGDLVFFDWSGNGSSQHVGIVDYVSGSTVHTIEGNCSGKVKAREYTTSGSKPYNNVSSIMGYAVPDFSKVSSGGSAQTTKKTTAKTTTKKQTQATTKKQTVKTTTKATVKTTEKTTKSTTASTTKKQTTTEPVKVEKLTISASDYELKVGDTVKLNYNVEPEKAKAVIGYFCDEEGIIQIDTGGDITAIGSGTATVVVCANDELYSQCSFTVTDAVAEVTTLSSDTPRQVVGKVESKEETTKNIKSMLAAMGVNFHALEQNSEQYFIPLGIITGTALICVFILIGKKIRKRTGSK